MKGVYATYAVALGTAQTLLIIVINMPNKQRQGITLTTSSTEYEKQKTERSEQPGFRHSKLFRFKLQIATGSLECMQGCWKYN